MHTGSENGDKNSSLAIYEYPYVTKYLRGVTCCTYVPVSPVFDKDVNCSCCCRPKYGNDMIKSGYENKIALDDTEITTKL